METRSERVAKRRKSRQIRAKDNRFQWSCVDVNPKDTNKMNDLLAAIGNREHVSFRTLFDNVNREDFLKLAHNLGYYNGTINIRNDKCFICYKTRLFDGKIAYYFEHSAIEYLFFNDKG